MSRITKEKRLRLVALCVSLLSCWLLFFTFWLLNKYDHIYLDQLLYQLKSKGRGASAAVVLPAIGIIFGLGSVFWGLLLGLYRVLIGSAKDLKVRFPRYIAYCNSKACVFFKVRLLPLTMAFLVAVLMFFAAELRVVPYLRTNATESDFIEEHYVAPTDEVLTFPQQKRNLIYIFLESMENTYTSADNGGAMVTDIIPELTALARDNISFSNTEQMGGAYSFTGTTWTAAAMVSATSGLPVKVPLSAEAYGGENRYIPGIISLGEVLERHGYNQTLLVGSDAAFAGRDSYFSQHGNYKILDINALKAAGRLQPDYNVWWGFEDEKLITFAKEELTELYRAGKPFNLTMLTVDTHFPDGYVCENCGTQYEEQYSNVLACSSAQIGAFVQWISEQPFYEDTLIVLSGDHLTMDPTYLAKLDPTYIRTVYNCFINSAVNPMQTQNRAFGTFDLFPTTLAALGVRIKDDRLGLGTDLFSTRPTLCEEMGFEALDAELQLKSAFYNRVFLGLDSKDDV